MPDRERDLEKELRELGSHLEYPPTPDLARAARQRLEEEQAGEERRSYRRGRFWLPRPLPRWAVAAMFVIVLAVPVLSPSARDALSGLFVMGGGASSTAGRGAAQSGGEAGGEAGVASEDKMMSEQAGSQAASAEAESIPDSAGGGQEESSASSSAEAAIAIGAGKITLREAQRRAGPERPLLLPEAPATGRPDEVYDAYARYGSALGLVYRASPSLPSLGDTEIGMVLSEAPGSLGSTYLRNGPKRTTLEEVNVGGRAGYWISAARLDPLTSGQTTAGRTGRPRASVLLWQRDRLALRLESNLTRAEAVRIAESVR